ncbi:uncharacterized protein B0T15DRAFT_499748 [Chaetomium strumarium]|uniref:Uncharacterized protein n=1 Tax=Chaetomium strumarium TaxID=1170767 RepID=A0AAJ0GXA6_9PEZI|nr:hypothetical protein B0T15DRAFT_499748 [Chaetomium strumarium]
MSEKRDSSQFINPSNLTLPSTPSAAAYRNLKSETLAAEAASTTLTRTNTAAPSLSSPDRYPAPFTTENIHYTPREIAFKRTICAIERLKIAQEGWALVAQALVQSGTIPDNETVSREMSAFGHALCGRHAAAFFLANALEDMSPEDWFARGQSQRRKWDATLRRLQTLKGLEASLVCWERVVLELVDLVERREASSRRDEWDYEVEWTERLSKVLGRWREGLPSRP